MSNCNIKKHIQNLHIYIFSNIIYMSKLFYNKKLIKWKVLQKKL